MLLTRGLIRVAPVVRPLVRTQVVPFSACYLCGRPYVEVDGRPLCQGCLREEQERERDYRAELEQKRRPL